MQARINDIKKKLEWRTGELRQIEKQIARLETDTVAMKETMVNIEQALVVAQAVAKLTQEQLRIQVNDVVTMALNTVFPERYEFHLDFEIKRGKTEAVISLTQNKDRLDDPMGETGGGVVDVLSFALRISCFLFKRNSLRPTIILDEPFRFVSKDLQDRVGQILKRMAKKMKIQFIIVTHEEALWDSADKEFTVRKVGKTSKLV